jgi:hypothetical protein
MLAGTCATTEATAADDVGVVAAVEVEELLLELELLDPHPATANPVTPHTAMPSNPALRRIK